MAIFNDPLSYDDELGLLGGLGGLSGLSGASTALGAGVDSGLNNSNAGKDPIDEVANQLAYQAGQTINDILKAQYADFTNLSEFQICEKCNDTGWLEGNQFTPSGEIKDVKYACSCSKGDTVVKHLADVSKMSYEVSKMSYMGKIEDDKTKMDNDIKYKLKINNILDKIKELEAKKNKKSLAKILGLANDKETEKAIDKLTAELKEYKQQQSVKINNIISNYYDKKSIENLKSRVPFTGKNIGMYPGALMPGSLGGQSVKPYKEPDSPKMPEVIVEVEPKGRKFKEPL